ncbi:MAG TPA: DUF6247 family protein [Pseudonocardiaceae bacterium]|nr:DUF6247 family protein [Pseudonocardiaceae bacterium]
MTTPEPSPASPVPVAAYTRWVEKTPAAIRNALDPALREEFDAEYREALARAAETLDLEPVITLVQHTWWVRAVICLNPEILDGVADDLKRVKAGDESVFAAEAR